MNNQPIIHVGYPKAASTTLQCNLFFEHYEINYLSVQGPIHKENFQIDENFRKFYKDLVTMNGIEYHYSNTRNFFNDVIKKYMSSEKRNLFSHEMLINQGKLDNALRAYRLKEIFPNAKIIIVLRNQVNMAISMYDMSPFIELGNEVRYITFYQWLNMNFKYPDNNFLGGLKYYETVSLYKEIFGNNNVGIFLLEELSENTDVFAQKLSEFINVDANQTKHLLKNKSVNTAKSHHVHNLRVKFIPGIQFSKVLPKSTHKYLVNKLTEVLPSKKSVMSQYYVDKMHEIYGLSNRKLMDEFGLDVAHYGYPLI
jgi:hypothetical protein